jgi:Rrf2 family iron-sulfur cluster assembly transcriptional regulator
VAQIIDAVNDTVDATGCGGKADCQQGEVCLTHYLWCDLSDQIHGFLSEISLSNLLEKREVLNIAARQDARSQASQSLPVMGIQGDTLLVTEI